MDAISFAYRPSILAAPFVKHDGGAMVELLSSTEQAALAELAQLMHIRRHTVLYPEGGVARYVYNLVEGVTATYHLEPNGEKTVTAFLFPGDLMGLSENGQYVATAQAISPVVAYRIDVDDLQTILMRDPQLDIGLLTKLCHDIRSSHRHSIDMSKYDAQARVASFLLWIDSVPGVARLDGDLVLPMPRHDIADYLGLSTEAVSRALHRLETMGAIRRNRPRVVSILDAVALARVAEVH